MASTIFFGAASVCFLLDVYVGSVSKYGFEKKTYTRGILQRFVIISLIMAFGLKLIS